jgi:membrane protein DedA with SNARE-associated domain
LDVQAFTQPVIEFVRTHSEWAPLVVGLLALAESIALFSLLVPATVLLMGIGALIGATGIEFWPMWAGAVIGAGLGDTISYWLGRHFHDPISRMWPLNKHPDLLPRGHSFFERWGVFGVFIGRFFGPLRATVPLAAGACAMPFIPFQITNWLSASAWAGLMLGPGAYSMEQVGRMLN